jgi:DNA polymerase-3 subunit beta
MQLKQVARDSLLKPLQAVSGIVERRHTLPILSNVLLEHGEGRLQITATDLEIQITASTDLDGSHERAITVPARKLQDLLRALPEDAALSLDATGGKLAVRAGRSRFNLQTLPPDDFPRMALAEAEVQSISLPQRQLKALFALVEFSMAQQDIRYYLNGMLLVIDKGLLQAVATDGHRLSWASLPVEGDFARQEVILPRKTVLEVTKLLGEVDEPVQLDVIGTQVRFRFANVELVSKVIDGKFPDFNRVIPVGHPKIIPLDRIVLLQALQRAAILSNEKFRGVRLVLTPGSLRIICTNSEQEEAEEELEVAYQGEGLDIGFNINYLLDVLNNLSTPEVTIAFADPNSSALITMPERTDYKYVVMPMRI